MPDRQPRVTMASLYETEVVNSATRLEMRLGGVHPRLFLEEAGIQALRVKCQREPWASMLRRLCTLAESGRPHEGRLPGGRQAGQGSLHRYT